MFRFYGSLNTGLIFSQTSCSCSKTLLWKSGPWRDNDNCLARMSHKWTKNKDSCPRRWLWSYWGTDDETLVKFTGCTRIYPLYYLFISSSIYSLCSRRDLLGLGVCVWEGGGYGVIFRLRKSQGGNSLGGDAQNRLLRFDMFSDIAVHWTAKLDWLINL